MCSADSLPSTPAPATLVPQISTAPSQFLLNLASPSAASLHNTTLKLKALLECTELADNTRAELCPSGFSLGDLFNMFAWSQADRSWKALAYGAKEPTLYNLVRLLAPACQLPDPSDLTKKEISIWFHRVQVAQKKHLKELTHLRSKAGRGAFADRMGNQTFLRVVLLRDKQLLDFKGSQEDFGLRRGGRTLTSPPAPAAPRVAPWLTW